MKRIDTPTALPDKHGPGRDGFTYLPFPTEIDDTILDHFQEELARILETHGIALDPGNLEQISELLRDYVAYAHVSGSFVMDDGLQLSDGGGLNVAISPGTYANVGRRVYISSADIASILPGGLLAVPDNATSKIYMDAQDDPTTVTFASVDIAALPPYLGASAIFLGIVSTSAGSIVSFSFEDRSAEDIASLGFPYNVSRYPRFTPALTAQNIFAAGAESHIGNDHPSYLGSQGNNSNFFLGGCIKVINQRFGSQEGLKQMYAFADEIAALGSGGLTLISGFQLATSGNVGITVEVTVTGQNQPGASLFRVKSILTATWDADILLLTSHPVSTLSTQTIGAAIAPTLAITQSGSTISFQITNNALQIYDVIADITFTMTRCIEARLTGF